MSDTPISDSTPHNVADLGMLCRRLERELDAASKERDDALMMLGMYRMKSDEQKQRIKRLEEAGDAMAIAYEEICFDRYDDEQIANWNKAKEAKL